MARARKRGDSTYNARRRFVREAERFNKLANKSAGAERDRYTFLAKESLSKAAELYENRGKIKRSSSFSRLANELGVSLDEFKYSEKRAETLKRQSEKLVKLSPRERMARAILDSSVGSRIYGGLVDVWAQPTYKNGEIVYRRSAEDIDQLIMQHYGVDSMMDVIELLEKEGTNLYADPESLEKYDLLTLQIMQGLF